MKFYQTIKLRKPTGYGGCMCGCGMQELKCEEVEVQVEYDTEKDFFENQNKLAEIKIRLQKQIDESDEVKKIREDHRRK